MNSSLDDNICRTCMKNEGKLRSVFSTNKKLSFKFSEMINICTELEVTENDELPKVICSKCVYNLTTLYQFRQSCIKSDQNLREKLLQKLIKPELTETNDNQPDLKTEVLPNKEIEIVKEKIEINKLVQEEEPEIDKTDEKAKKGEKLGGTKKKTKRPHPCEVCGKFLSCHSNLVQHMRRHTGERPFMCDLCGKAFSRAEHLTIHKRIHSGERPHSCNICGKSFVQAAALTCHLRTHTGARPYVCCTCGKAFAQAVTLTYHARTHSGETPHVCSICGKGFTHAGNLNIHMRFHNGDRPFLCTHCGQRFVTSSHLSVHIKQHTGERNHRCTACGKAFIRKEHLRAHAASHAGLKNHVCCLCGKRYGQSSHLSRHLKTHKNVPNQTNQPTQVAQTTPQQQLQQKSNEDLLRV